MKIDGGCHCGYIAYEAEADPAEARICHCTDCQTLSGSAFRTVLPTREGPFKLRSGELKIYVKTGESGTARPQFGGSKSSPLSPQAALLATNLECLLMAQSGHS